MEKTPVDDEWCSKTPKTNTGRGKDTKAPAVMKITRSMPGREMLHRI